MEIRGKMFAISTSSVFLRLFGEIGAISLLPKIAWKRNKHETQILYLDMTCRLQKKKGL